MKKKDFTFIIGLTLLFAVIWIVGELIMGIYIAVYSWVFIVWRVLIVVGCLSISIWHSFKDENFDDDDKNNKND